ncbi:Enoyl-CoA hydratase EchA9 [Apophysomyces sp. BC1034]|nr:Enoyl-CoA hydratase EchA9 [Apophysomyces sp. BC1015]KAG0177772.1 Enoyl-CoA hydratase EchA9 [Apophysomyces sp. BC1021]KAG0187538.1 Enoyl-CoA hydratase EchA9 [Apophysomyces sp. BC1034]
MTMQLSSFTEDQRKVFTAFRSYPWDEDPSFNTGVHRIMENMDEDTIDMAQMQEKILQAKHYYYSKLKEPFELKEYIEYEAALNESTKDQVLLFERLEEYDFDNDPKYVAGLPNVIKGWVDENEKGWGKAQLDAEFTKIKAFYYATCIEKVDVPAYLSWKKQNEKSTQSVCPFANLWQNKGKAEPAQRPSSLDFVTTEKSHGTHIIILSGPNSGNLLTLARLKEVGNAIRDAHEDDSVTSIVINPIAVENPAPEGSEPVNGQIVSWDKKTLTKGLAFEETAGLVEDAPDVLRVSQQKLADAYYDEVQASFNHKKPIVHLLNGIIPSHTSYLSVWFGFMRVVTEHAVLDLQLCPAHAPIPPLLLLSFTRGLAEKKLPAGIDLYLALAPSELTKLRGPELLRLGLADAFVPELKLNDAFKDIKCMALCPPPSTEKAIGFAAMVYHTYPGPDRLSVWEDEIESVFGAAESFEDLLDRLKKTDNKWSKTILAYWDTLPPTLIKVVFKAVQKSRDIKEASEVLKMENNLNAKWRQTEDYRQWIADNGGNWAGRLEETDEESVQFYFDDLDVDEATPVIYDAPAEKPTDPMVCPVTGQKGAMACPVTGQTSIPQEDAAVCPVTGQSSIPQEGAAVCPVTGQKSASSGCPVSGH